MMSNKITLPSIPRVPVGEIRIWLTGLGVATGLIMIFGFLAIIVYNGLDAFWPKPAYEFTVNPAREGGQPQIFFANIAKDSERTVHDDSGSTQKVSEYQIFTGSKDVYGQSFRYIDKERIAQSEKPSDLLEVERLEGGKSIIRPLYIQEQGKEKIMAGSAEFIPELTRLTEYASGIRSRISRIEKSEIASINTRLDDANRDLKALSMSYEFKQENGVETAVMKANPVVEESDPVGEKQKLVKKIEQLHADYELYAAQTRQLRETEGKSFLYFQLGDGVERGMATDKMVGFIGPNQLGFFGKLGVFISRLWSFVTEDPREANTEGGIFPAIFGTFVMTVLMSALVTPIGVIAAVYLREYAKQGHLVKIVRICVNNLAGVPSIVFGVFGLGFFVYFIGGGIDELFFAKKLAVSQTPTFGTSGVLWASLTLALMTLPVVIVATEEALSAVPSGLREAALACGASKWQMIQRIILPNALPGVLTGVILAMARGAGEVAPLMVTGVVKLAPNLPIDFDAPFLHLERKFMHLGFHIYDVAFQSPDSDAARSMVFATTLLLIALVIVMNLTAIIIRNRLRQKHQLSSF